MDQIQLNILFERAVKAYGARHFGEAEHLCRQVLTHLRGHTVATSLLAHIALERLDFDEAERLGKKCATKEPAEPNHHLFLARLYAAQGRHDQAISRYDRVLRRRPDDGQAAAGKAKSLVERGDPERALEFLNRHRSRHGEPAETAVVRAGVLVRAGAYDEAIELTTAQLDPLPDNPDLQRELWSQLGRARERRGDIDRAFDAYRHSNAAAAPPSNIDASIAHIDELIETLSPALLASLAGHGNDSELPVFVAGMPRSGTTLIDRIIDAHPKAVGLVESMQMLERLTHDMTITIGSTLPYPACVADLEPEDIAKMGDALIAEMKRRAGGAVRAADKCLGNPRYLGLISILCPRARVIHVHRDPLDTCFSCYMELLHPADHPYSMDLSHLGRYYRAYARLMDHWKSCLQLPILDVAYEDLVTDPDAVIRRIIDFCGLDWDDACLDFHATGRTAPTLSHDQVRRPIYRSSAGRAQRFIEHLGPLVGALREGRPREATASPGVRHNAASAMTVSELHILYARAIKAYEARDLITAEALCRRVLAARRGHTETLSLLAHIAFDRLDFDEAERLGRKCATKEPAEPRHHLFLARLYTSQGRYDQAISRCERVLRRHPDHSWAAARKAKSLTDRGNPARALEFLDRYRAKHGEPAEVAAVRVGSLVLAGEYDAAIELAIAHLDPPPDNSDLQRELWSQLGRAYERRGDVDLAFDAYRRSNEAVAAPSSIDASIAQIDEIIETFSPEQLAALGGHGSDSELPVLIAGMPRSGTTLVDRIIDAHPRAVGLVETPVIDRLIFDMAMTIGSTLPYPRCIADLEPEDIAGLADTLIGGFQRRAPRAVRAAEKGIYNPRYLGLISILCPRARVIHIRRDPLDTCFSCFMELLPPSSCPYSTDLVHLGRYYRAHARLMNHWKRCLDLPILEVDYEDLVADPEPQIRRLIEFCGLEWDAACLDFHASGRTATLSQNQVRRPMYRSSMGRARRFIEHLGPLVEALGEG